METLVSVKIINVGQWLKYRIEYLLTWEDDDFIDKSAIKNCKLL